MFAGSHGFRAGAREQRFAHEQFLFRGILTAEEGPANPVKKLPVEERTMVFMKVPCGW